MVRVLSLFPALVLAADDASLKNLVCMGDNKDKFKCSDGTAWSGTSGTEMERVESCKTDADEGMCPPGMGSAYASSTGKTPKATCTGECLTCEMTEFENAKKTYTMDTTLKSSNYQGCNADKNEYTNKVSGSDSTNKFTAGAQSCSNGFATGTFAKCVGNSIEVSVCNWDCKKHTGLKEVDTDKMDCVSCIVAGDGKGGGGKSGNSSNDTDGAHPVAWAGAVSAMVLFGASTVL